MIINEKKKKIQVPITGKPRQQNCKPHQRRPPAQPLQLPVPCRSREPRSIGVRVPRVAVPFPATWGQLRPALLTSSILRTRPHSLGPQQERSLRQRRREVGDRRAPWNRQTSQERFSEYVSIIRRGGALGMSYLGHVSSTGWKPNTCSHAALSRSSNAFRQEESVMPGSGKRPRNCKLFFFVAFTGPG